MSISTPEEVLERALLSERGIKISFSSLQEGASFRTQCYGVLRTERRRNIKELGDSETEFDHLTLSLSETKSGSELRITFKAQNLEVEDL